MRPPTRIYTHTRPPTHLTDFNTTSACILQPSQASYSEPRPMALMYEHVFAHITTNPDTMTVTKAEALRQPDFDKFLTTMHKELNDHSGRFHWKVLPKKYVPLIKRGFLCYGP